jgi:branched-chain amino acid transport system substrate-binding protein
MRLWVAAVLLAGWASAAHAADTVTVGAIYSATGDHTTRAAIETGEDIVNVLHPGLESLPLGTGHGLPHLGGAKIAADFADDLANPSVATAQALRLITQDHVAALIGDGLRPVASADLAERHGVPLLALSPTRPSFSSRGTKSIFVTAPDIDDIARTYAQFFAAQPGGKKIGKLALVSDDGETDRARAIALGDVLRAAGFDTTDIVYPAAATDLTATVAKLRAANPDAAIFVSRAADATLLTKTMQNAGYRAPIEIGDAGFSDPAFVTAVGNLAQGVISHSAWSLGPSGSPTAIVNDLYKAKSGGDLDDASAQVLQGFLVLAAAIDRAGSADPAAIQAALQQTDLTPPQLIVGYGGVKFNATGLNTLASTYLTQLHGKRYVTVWPAANATEKLELPFKGWQ